jgi:glutamine amidotransferase-like uncharacterized protein
MSLPAQIRQGRKAREAPVRKGAGEMAVPRIGIFSGLGASHSWLWFVDLFEQKGYDELVFFDERQIREGLFQGCRCLAFSGGDTITMAEGLGAAGAAQLSTFVRQGGLYLGSCAGAYLPLHSSKEHLNLFNFVEAKITNLTAQVPSSLTLPPKSITPYGCSFIFHPVREEVSLSTTGVPPFVQGTSFPAPLYGGPGLTAEAPCQILARYSAFTGRTRFLVDPSLARKTLIGQGAVIRKKLGRGQWYLFGPHFEHPYFPEANHWLHRIIQWEMGREDQAGEQKGKKDPPRYFNGQEGFDLLKPLKREISNARLVARGLEMTDLQWVIGHKIYEPIKISAFLEAVWKRIMALEKSRRPLWTAPEDAELVERAGTVTGLVRRIKAEADKSRDTGAEAASLFEHLKSLCRRFLTLYFRKEAYG